MCVGAEASAEIGGIAQVRGLDLPAEVRREDAEREVEGYGLRLERVEARVVAREAHAADEATGPGACAGRFESERQ